MWDGFDEEWLRQRRERMGKAADDSHAERKTEGGGKSRARGERPVERMNKTEAKYARRLEADPSVIDFHYEQIGFRLGKGVFHYPDFFVLRDTGLVEIHEVKGGYRRDSGEQKFKVAADLYDWFNWQMWQYKNKQWELVRNP